MSDYDDGWNEGFDLGARKVKKLQAENDRLRKAILIWWRGSPEDTGSEVQLRSVATELLEVK
jgi:hypothetical protein